MFLEINNLKKSFGTGESRVEVLKGIQFSVEKGEICVLLGPSGSGKSTLLNIIGGIDEADSGSIVIEGEKIEDMNEKTLTRYRRKHLGYVFQMYNLIPNLTVKENMEVGAYLSDHPLDINDLLKTLGLYDHRNKLPNQLSGGQQQRTSIGRAIIKNPSILLCDEPTGALVCATARSVKTTSMRPKSPPAIWTGKAGWKYEKSITKTPAAGTEERYWKISRYFSVYDGDDWLCVRFSRCG